MNNVFSSEDAVKNRLKKTSLNDVYDSICEKTSCYDREEYDQEISDKFIAYFEELKRNGIVDNTYLNRVVGKFMMEKRLTAKILLYLLEQEGLDLYYSPVSYMGPDCSIIEALAIMANDGKIIEKILEKNTKNKKIFDNGWSNSTNIIRMLVRAGNLKKALEEFDKDTSVFDKEEHLGWLLENESSRIENDYDGRVYCDELYLLLDEVRYGSFDEQTKHLFTQAVVYSDRIKMISIQALPLIEELLGEEDYDHFMNYLSQEISDNKKALFNYSDSNRSHIEGVAIKDIEYVDINDVRNRNLKLVGEQLTKKKDETNKN